MTDQQSPENPRKRKLRATKRGGLWVNDAELIEILNVPEKIARQSIYMLDAHHCESGFPQKQKLWGDKRYLPAVEAYFEHLYGFKARGNVTRSDRARIPTAAPTGRPR